MALKSDAKFEKKLTCGLENDIMNFSIFYQSTRKSQNWKFDWILLSKVKKCMSLKFTEELCVMAMKNDAKFEEGLTCRFKIGMRNLTNFDPITQKSRKFEL